MGLHRLGIVRVQSLRFDETCALLRVGLENAVDDDDMEVDVLGQRGTESVGEGHRPGSRLRTRAGAGGEEASESFAFAHEMERKKA